MSKEIKPNRSSIIRVIISNYDNKDKRSKSKIQ